MNEYLKKTKTKCGAGQLFSVSCVHKVNQFGLTDVICYTKIHFLLVITGFELHLCKHENFTPVC